MVGDNLGPISANFSPDPTAEEESGNKAEAEGGDNATSSEKVEPVCTTMAKVFEEAARHMEDTWEQAGSPADWPLEKWDGITNGALSRMLRLVILSVPKAELVKRTSAALAEKATISGKGNQAAVDKPDPTFQQNAISHHLFRVVLTGDSRVGKSNGTCTASSNLPKLAGSPVLSRYAHNQFTADWKPTLAVEFSIKRVNVENKAFRAQIWDLSGQERFRPITTTYYRGMMGVMLLYDITKRETFDNISIWLRDVREHNGRPNVVVMLVGNKSDLKDLRQVPTDQAQAFATENGLLFAEVSAHDSSNIEDVFLMFLTEIFQSNKVRP